jgi:DNA replication protein DnaC
VCRGSFAIAEALPVLELCDEHWEAMVQHRAAEALRRTIPPGLHHAHPRDLPELVAGWSSLDGTGLYLYGPVGVGKSHAAAALVKKAWMEQFRAGRSAHAVWLNVPSAILATLAAFGRRSADASKAWDEAQSSSVLVLDDIGVEDPKDWVRARLYGLVEHRLQHRLPTIVTSNLDLGQLADRLGSPQIASRLSQMTAQVSFASSSDRRPGLAPTLGKEGGDADS